MSRTPGPWAVHPDFRHVVVPESDIKKKIGGADTPDREFELYAKQIHADWHAIPPYGYNRASYSRTRVQQEEAYANARVIAATPKLLEACKALCLFFDTHLNCDDCLDEDALCERCSGLQEEAGKLALIGVQEAERGSRA